MQTMYPAINNSPVTELVSAISASDTTIEVLNGDALPDAPNLAVLGRGEVSEVILYTTKTGNVLGGVTRGFDGTTATAWGVNTNVARNFTKYDYDAFKSNIELAGDHIDNSGIHVTPEEKIEFASKATKSDIDNANKFVLTTGTNTAYEVTIDTAATDYYRGMRVSIELHEDAGASPTINVNGWGAVSASELKKAGFYTLVYDGTSFISVSGKGGGSEASLNVFAQSVLPSEGFEGIVVAEDLPISKIVTDSDWYLANTFNEDSTTHALSNTPATRFSTIGSKLFYTTNNSQDIYVYDKNTRITSVLCTISQPSFTNIGLLPIGIDLYLLRQGTSNTTAHLFKINTLTGIATTLATFNSTSGVYASSMVEYNNSLFVSPFASTAGTIRLLEYSITNNTWTARGNLIDSTNYSSVAMVRKGNVAFVLRSTVSNKVFHQLNLDTLVATPITLSGISVNANFYATLTGDKMYLHSSASKNLYSIDVSQVTSSYTAVEYINPTTLSASSGYRGLEVIGNEIWLMNKADDTDLITRFMLNDKVYESNTLIIKRLSNIAGMYRTQLFNHELSGVNNRLLVGFDDVAYHDGNSLITDFDAYYGDGEQWVPFKVA